MKRVGLTAGFALAAIATAALMSGPVEAQMAPSPGDPTPSVTATPGAFQHEVGMTTTGIDQMATPAPAASATP